MPATVLVGTQFGDEGKGKIVDALSEQFDFVVRFNGGANAGHTVTAEGKVHKLHLLPSGILRPGVRNLLAPGVAVDPELLVEELDTLKTAGFSVTPKHLGIDFRAPLVLPWHKMLDAAREDHALTQRIGTTKKGIGPAYEDQAARTGLRFEDLLDAARLDKRLHDSYALFERIVEHGYEYVLPQAFREHEVADDFRGLAEKLSPFACDVSAELHAALAKKKRVLFEGAQGTFLDNRFGTYPFVTASYCLASAAPLMAGLPPQSINEVEGVVKAYATRVGNGPFPTELSGKLADQIREKGGEYGTTTGRPRRVGWIDLPMLRFAVRSNGLSGFHLTKLDVLAGLKEIKMATHYEIAGKRYGEIPANTLLLESAKPVYEAAAGFQLPGKLPAKGLEALPEKALAYVRFLEKELGVPALSVSYGPERTQTVFR